MTKSKTFIAAIALAATFTAIGSQAQAHPHWGHHGWGIGAGFVAGSQLLLLRARLRLPLCRCLRPLGQSALRESLRRRPVLISAAIGACPPSIHAPIVKDPPGMSPSGRVTFLQPYNL